MDGILNVDKPAGWTSHEVVKRIRAVTGVSKVGHTGTLDPLATGVLLLCVGKATRIAQYLSTLEKEYVTTIRLGVVTDTLDADGTVREQHEVNASIEDVQKMLPSFLGETEQTPPMFSAVKQGGKRLYQLARSGRTVARAPRTVHIFGINVIDCVDHDVTLQVRCSKGTYIRSLARDIGTRLGCGAHVVSLLRTRVGDFRLEQSLSVEEVERLNEAGQLRAHLMSLNEALSDLPEVRVGEQSRWRIEHGSPVALEDVDVTSQWSELQGPVRIVTEDNILVGLGEVDTSDTPTSAALRPIRVFA